MPATLGGGGPAPPRARQRKAALHVGAVLPTEYLAQMAEVDESEGGSDAGRLGSEGLGAADAPAAAAPAGPADCGATGTPEPAAAIVAAPPQPGVAAGTTAQAQAEPVPAYTSLARLQLQQRLKAAIAAGTRSAAGSAAEAALAGGKQPPATASRQQRRGSLRPGSRLPPVPVQPSGEPPRPSHALPALPVLTSALSPPGEVPAALPLPVLAVPPISLDDRSGYQLPLPGCSSNCSSAAEQRQQAGAVRPPASAPGPPSSRAAPHWLVAQLRQQQQHEYHSVGPSRRPPGWQQHGAAALPPQAGVQRGLLTLLMPPLTERFTGGRAASWHLSCILSCNRRSSPPCPMLAGAACRAHAPPAAGRLWPGASAGASFRCPQRAH